MFFRIALYDNLILILRYFSLLYHDSFLIFTTLIYELSYVDLTSTNKFFFSILVVVATIVDWKFNIVRNPAHTFIIKALFELLIKWLFDDEGSRCFVFWFKVSWDFLAVARELNSDLLLRIRDIQLDLLDNKAHFYFLLSERFLFDIAFTFFANRYLNFTISIVLALLFFLFIIVLLLFTLIFFLLLLSLLGHVLCGVRSLGYRLIFETVEPIERHLIFFSARYKYI